MHNSESVLENDTLKILKDDEIKIHHLISTRRTDLLIVNKKKKNLTNSGLWRPGRPQRRI